MKQRLRGIREAVSLPHAIKTWKDGRRWGLAPHHVRLQFLLQSRGALNKYQIYTALLKMSTSMNPQQIERALAHLQENRLVREAGKSNGIMRFTIDVEGEMALISLEEQIRRIRWDRIDTNSTPKRKKK